MARRSSADWEKLIVCDTVAAARALIGARLCRRDDSDTARRFVITETEAYDGFEDRASHASRGPTPRNAPMFGPAGVWYVYLCYGMHEMLNLVTREGGYPAAILLRGVWEAGAAGSPGVRRIVGPGRLTRTLGVSRHEFNGVAASPVSGLWIESGEAIPDSRVSVTPRIGVAYAGAEWAAAPRRFVLRD